MGKKSTPAAPDLVATSAAQMDQNKAATQASAATNAVDIYGPWGNTTYQFGNRGGMENIPVSQHTNLTPAGQQVFDTQQGIAVDLSNRAQTALGQAPQQAMSFDGIGYDPNGYNTGAMPMYSATSYGRNFSSPSGSLWGGAQPQSGAASGGAVGNGTPTMAGSAGGDTLGAGSNPAPQPNGGGMWNMPGTQSGGEVLPYDPRSYDVSAINRDAQSTAYDEVMRNVQPQFDLQNQRMEDNLHNRGIPIGSKAWSQAMGDMNRTQQNTMLGASNQAYMTGHQVAGDIISREQGLRGTAFGEGMQTHQQSQSDFMNRVQLEQGLRSSAIGERERLRTSAVNDASLYLQGAPAMQTPNAPSVPNYQIAAPDLMGATYQSYNAANQAAQSKNASNAQAVGNVAQSAMWMMSSVVLKEDIGDADAFLSRVEMLPVRTWRYTEDVAGATGVDTDLHIGPLAEDWAALFGGPDTRIHIGDALFVLYRAVQELSSKVKQMERVA